MEWTDELLFAALVRAASRLVGEFDQERLALGGVFRGLDDEIVPRQGRLQHLDAEQLDRVVPGRDDADRAEGGVLNSMLLPEQPDRAAFQSPCLQNASSLSLVPAAGRDQRKKLRGDRLMSGLPELRVGQTNEFLGSLQNQVAKTSGPA